MRTPSGLLTNLLGPLGKTSSGLTLTAPRAQACKHAVTTSSRRMCSASASAVDKVTDFQGAVVALHQSPAKAALIITGGGFQALTDILTVPGASRTVLDVRVPYANSSLADVLGFMPERYADPATASAMARKAYQQAANMAAFGEEILGVSLTCALATDRTKKGEHKAIAATHTGQRTTTYVLQMVKGRRDRAEEDAVASRLLLHALCSASLASGTFQVPLLLHDDEARPQESSETLDDPLTALVEGKVQTVEYSGGHVIVDAPRRGRIYLPGSFNPLHDGHRGMLAAACKLEDREQDGCFELSVGNADKGFLELDVIQQRVQQFVDAGLPVVVTQAPLYTIKAKILPDSVFVVGFDTAIRLIDPKYYGGDTGMLLQFAELAHLGCRFLVAGRVADDEHFMQLSDMDLPEELSQMEIFKDIPEQAFRSDISSTQLREQQGQA